MSNETEARPVSVARAFGANGRLGLGATLVIDLVLPFVAARALDHQGVEAIPAFAAAAVFPLGSIVFSWIARRRVEIVGAAAVATILCGIAVSALSGDPRFSILKAAPAFRLFALACLGSLVAARPLMFHVARIFVAGRDGAKAAAAFTLPAQLALVAEPVMGFATVATLLAWTAAFARRSETPR
jgi:hypothetical protein